MSVDHGCKARQDVMAVIYGLIIIGLVALVGIILLRFNGKESGTLDTVVVGVVTAVGALLASTSRRDNGPVQAEITNPPSDPVNVQAAAPKAEEGEAA